MTERKKKNNAKSVDQVTNIDFTQKKKIKIYSTYIWTCTYIPMYVYVMYIYISNIYESRLKCISIL